MRKKAKQKKQVKTRSIDGRSYLVDAENLLLDVRVYGIAVHDGKVLVVPQFDGYDYPGGAIELGETHEETLKREFKEETGCDAEPAKLLTIYTSFFRHMFNRTDHQSLLVYYAVNITSGELSEDGLTESEKRYASLAQWIPINELKKFHHMCSIDIADELIELAKKLDEEAQAERAKKVEETDKAGAPNNSEGEAKKTRKAKKKPEEAGEAEDPIKAEEAEKPKKTKKAAKLEETGRPEELGAKEDSGESGIKDDSSNGAEKPKRKVGRPRKTAKPEEELSKVKASKTE